MEFNLDIFKQIFDATDEPIFIHDEEFRVILGNHAYYHEAGMAEAEGIGRPYWEVFPKGSGPMPSCRGASENKSLKASQDEVRVGDKVFISNGYISRDATGKTLYALHTFRDDSKAALLEKSLKDISSQFLILFQLSPDAIMLLDDKSFFDCNPATLKIFGCAHRSEFIGKHPSQFSPALQPGGIDSMVLANERIGYAMENGVNRFEWDHCRLDGSIFPAEVLLIAFEREGKQVLQATVTDITARKKEELELRDTVIKLNLSLAAIVTTMSRTMELRDPYTAGHQTRVAAISCAIAKELGWNEDRIKGLQMAGLIHDIGKIGIPAEILSKPSRLSEFEEKLMEEHAEHSFQLLKGIDFPWPIAEMVHQHHERMDGSGYPHGLKGDEIMFEGRVLAVADTIEAMSTHRPYRPALGLPAAIKEIKAQSGIQLDEQVVNAALHLFEGKPSLDGLV